MPPQPKEKSYLEESFALMLRNFDLPAGVREYRFHPPRRWRFDFCWPSARFAVEIEGIGRADGGASGHRTRAGFLADAEKYEAAMSDGWTVYRIPGPWVATRTRHIWRAEMIETLRAFLS